MGRHTLYPTFPALSTYAINQNRATFYLRPDLLYTGVSYVMAESRGVDPHTLTGAFHFQDEVVSRYN